MNQEVAKDLIELVNSLKGFAKSAKVEYGKTVFNYTPLDDLASKIKENNKFCLLQPLHEVDGKPCIENILVHHSGETLSSGNFELLFVGAKMQDVGSVITYTRRYTLASWLGIVSDEDDDAKPKIEVLPINEKQIAWFEKVFNTENNQARLKDFLKEYKVETILQLNEEQATKLMDYVRSISKK